MNLFGLKSVYRAFLRREVYAENYHLAAVGGVGFGVAFLVYLVESSLCRTVELELNDIDIVGALDYTVDASLACFLLCHGIVEAEHLHDEIERVLEISLALHLVLLALEAIRDG